ncbi:isoleucine-tRNA ligase, partial [Tulasnella sp. 427]
MLSTSVLARPPRSIRIHALGAPLTRSALCRYSSSSTSKDAKNGSTKSYAATMMLPKTTFPQWAEPSVREEPYRARTTSELYKWQAEQKDRDLFVLHDGPPYANGHLHMGHALNKILKDIINRFQVLQGKRVRCVNMGHQHMPGTNEDISYIPGWDCHGLPIEHKALKELGTGHESISPIAIRKIARQNAERDMQVQMEEFKQFGIMADWSHEGTYRTMDHDYEIRQLRVFQELVRKGLISRRYRPVHWSPSSKSALAEAELQYVEDHKSFPVYVKFQVSEDRMASGLADMVQNLRKDPSETVHLVIWTTTPWTLPANMAIGVNANLDYALIRRTEHPDEGLLIIGKDRLEALNKVLGEFEVLDILPGSALTGTAYSHLFHPSTSPAPLVTEWSDVEANTGTGLVHMAPGHGKEDYAALTATGLLNKVNIVCPVDDGGRYTEEVVGLAKDAAIGERLRGKEVLSDGGKEMVGILKEYGVLVGQGTLKHKYPYDWKTKKPIILRATSQWFANVDDIKGAALKALGKVKFQPEISRSRLESFVRERSEWCISRQRAWGVPIPALYDAETNEAILTAESLDHIIPVLSERGVDHWFEGPVEDFIPPRLRNNGRKYVKGTDTVDVWFDSGTSWSLIKERIPKEDRGRLCDVYLEGSDQHRGWFQSSLLTATGAAELGREAAPYKDLITHGFVLDDKGRKMSKSDGNVISPLTIINGGENKKKDPAYGADLLRLWAASVEYGRDVSIGPKVLAQSAETLRKLRNSVRFMLANLKDGEAVRGDFQTATQLEFSLIDKYVMLHLQQLEQTCWEAYRDYNFPRVVASLNRFATNTLSSLYFDVTKDTLYADAVSHPTRRATITVLHEVVRTLIAILSPILPHLAEEVNQTLHEQRSQTPSSAFTSGWRKLSSNWNDPSVSRRMDTLLQVRSEVMIALEQARKDKRIGGSLEAALEIVLPDTKATNSIAEILLTEESILKTLFVVSDVQVLHQAEATQDRLYCERQIDD